MGSKGEGMDGRTVIEGGLTLLSRVDLVTVGSSSEVSCRVPQRRSFSSLAKAMNSIFQLPWYRLQLTSVDGYSFGRGMRSFNEERSEVDINTCRQEFDLYRL
jgi:hypothetical protein